MSKSSPRLPSFETFAPSPDESLSHELTRAILAIAVRHPSLHRRVLDTTSRYIGNVHDTAQAITGDLSRASKSSGLDSSRTLDTATLTASLLGFLEAASAFTDFYDPSERLDLLRQIRLILGEAFMLAVEGVFSSIRTSRCILQGLVVLEGVRKKIRCVREAFGSHTAPMRLPEAPGLL